MIISCKVDNCNCTTIKARGMCNKHLSKFYKYGDPLVKMRRESGTGHIRIDGYKWNTINGKRILEHRHVMEQHLGRKLLESKYETVHHLNKDKLDNRIENLQLTTLSEHTTHHLTRFPVVNNHKKCSSCHRVLPLKRFSKKMSACNKCRTKMNLKRIHLLKSR